MARGRDQFRKYKGLISLIAAFYALFPKRLQRRLLVRYRKTPGVRGLVLRYALLKNLARKVGDNVSVQPDVYLFNVENLSIGSNVSIHPMCYIEAYGGVEIGSDVAIAHGVTVMAVSHGFSELDVLIKDQPLIPQPIRIEDNVWLGAKAVILGGNTVGTGSVIAAGAVVTADVAPNTVAAGVPARPIRQRS